MFSSNYACTDVNWIKILDKLEMTEAIKAAEVVRQISTGPLAAEVERC